MALVTIQRSPSPSTDHDGDTLDSSDDISESRSQIRKRSRTSKEKLRKIFSSVRFIAKLRPCLSESYFTVKGAALILPHNECTRKASKKGHGHGGEIQGHLQAMLRLIRPEDKIKIAVRLEDLNPSYARYIALVSTLGKQDTEESVILGIDCTPTEALIGLVLPVWMGLQIQLGGDGGFSLCQDEHAYLLKPVSVQAMWSAIQSLWRAVQTAEDKKYIQDGLTHTWVGYYRSRIDHRDKARMCQWNAEGVQVFAPSSLSINPAEDVTKVAISQALKEVMMTVDLDEATSIMLRHAVEAKLKMSLTSFKSYFDEEMMRILGQMDEPSQILDFLYLGSEWNASNLEELKSKGIGYILNVTREIDNFFVGMFQYYTVRVYDVEESELLKHWHKTYKFITKARNHKSKVLVHCKMGVSRSASTVMAYLMKENQWSVDEVMAYLMKENQWSVDEAYKFVKAKRNCVHPNEGFMAQLHMYEGILSASAKRDVFRCQSQMNLSEEKAREAETTQGSFLGDSLFQTMSHSEEEWISSLHAGGPDILSVDKDFETESRSADSTEDILPDSPPPTSQYDSARLAITEHGDLAEQKKHLQVMTAQAASGTSRIRPDSSWIRLDACVDEMDDEGNKVSELSCSESLSVAPGAEFSQDASEQGICLEDATLTETDDSDFVTVTTDLQSDQSVSFLSCHDALNSAFTKVKAKETDLKDKLTNGKMSDSNSSGQTNVSSNEVAQEVNKVEEIIQEKNPSAKLAKTEAVSSEKSSDPSLSELPRHIALNKVELGVRQYFFREKIPWNPGKVKMIREVINTTGNLDCGDQDQESGSVNATQVVKQEESYETHELLESLSSTQRPSLPVSHSCGELCPPPSGDLDSSEEAETKSLYEKEEIPLEPGTVLRTRLEIEERQRLFCGEGDQEIFTTGQSVQRASSLKFPRDTPPAWSQRRLTCGPVMSPWNCHSLDDLRLTHLEDSLGESDDPSLLNDPLNSRSMSQDDTLNSMSMSQEDTLNSMSMSQDDTLNSRSMSQDNSLLEREEPSLGLGDRLSDKLTERQPVFSSEKQINHQAVSDRLTGSQATSKRQTSTQAMSDKQTGAQTMSDRLTGSQATFKRHPSTQAMSDKQTGAQAMSEKQTGAQAIAGARASLEAETTLTRDLGWALSMGTTQLKEGRKEDVGGGEGGVMEAEGGEEKCHNLVKYFVQKIEKPSQVIEGQKSEFREEETPPNAHFCPISSEVNSESKVSQGQNPSERSPVHSVPFTPDLSQPQRSPNDTDQDMSSIPSSPKSVSSMEPSVVRHLVGRFEIQSPDKERLTPDFGQDYAQKAKAGSTSPRMAAGGHHTSYYTNKASSECNSPSTVRQRLEPSHSVDRPSSMPVNIAVEIFGGDRNAQRLRKMSTESAPTDLMYGTPGSSQPHHTMSSTGQLQNADQGMGDLQDGLADVRPRSTDLIDCGNHESTTYGDKRSSQQLRYQDGEDQLEANFRQVSEEGRKIRRLHGKSHPLTKLSQKRLGGGPYHSSM